MPARVVAVISFVAAVITILTFTSYWYHLRRAASPIRRFLDLFHGMEKYRRRAKQDAKEKRLIGNYLAQQLLAEHNASLPTLFLESGTTSAEVGLALLDAGKSCVYTNNLLVGLAFAGKEEGALCHLLPGTIDDDYPGIVGDETLAILPEVLTRCRAVVMNATSFDIVTGPCVRSLENRAIKRCILENGSTIYLCLSSRKVIRRMTLPYDQSVPSIFTEEDWKKVLREKDMHLVFGTPSRWSRLRTALFEERWVGLLAYLEQAGIKHDLRQTGAERIRHIYLPVQPSAL